MTRASLAAAAALVFTFALVLAGALMLGRRLPTRMIAYTYTEMAVAGVPRDTSSSSIFALDIERGRAVEITKQAGSHYAPSWSPDGSAITYFSRPASRNDGVYVTELDGDTRLVFEHFALFAYPSWSPDGTRISIMNESIAGIGNVYLVNADGAGRRELAYFDEVSTLAWSPGGDRLLVGGGSYSARRTTNSILWWSVVMLDPEAATQQRVDFEWQANDTSPAWSPDGARIAFISDHDNLPRLYISATGGGAPQRLTDGASACPAWSPDGARIAFVMATEDDPRGDIFVIDADGANPVNLTQHPGADGCPAWSPDGSHIAYWSQHGRVRGIYLLSVERPGETRVLVPGAVNFAWRP